MKIEFSQDKRLVNFLPESAYETKRMANFPGLNKKDFSYSSPSIKPIVYNLISRLEKYLKAIHVAEDVDRWLEQGFKLKPLPEAFHFHTKPIDFQEIALRYMYTLGSAGILLDPGMGKSKVTLDYIFLRGFKKVLIVCPKPLMFVWEDEINTHRPELTSYCVKTTNWQEEEERIKDPSINVVIINYNKVVTFSTQLRNVGFEYIHLDEFLIKNVSTSRTKEITKLGRYIPYRSGGSGTLVNNSPLDVFCPVRFLQPALVGGDYTKFSDEYAVKRNVQDEKSGRNFKQIVAVRKKDEIRSILDSCCIVMTKDQWLKNLPSKTFLDYQVQLGDDQREAYYNLASNYRTEVQGEEIKVDNPLVMLSKLYQISNGFLYVAQESASEVSSELLPEELTKAKPKKRKTLFFKQQPKLYKLETLLASSLKNRKFILWFNMDAERELIEGLLARLGVNYLVIKGGDKGVGDKVRQFNSTPEIQILLCQAKSVNYGITVLGRKLKEEEEDTETTPEAVPNIDPRVWTQVFYSLNFSLEVFLQQQDRTHRIGQTKECEYIRLFANCPVEHKIKEALALKLHIKKSMLVDIANGVLAERNAEGSFNSISHL